MERLYGANLKQEWEVNRMREIKVRGYAVEELVGDQWVYGTGFHTTEFTKEFAEEVGKPGETFIFTESGWIEVYPESVGEYTGLKDKNDKEIYEKDITELEVDGEIRRFVVNIKTVIRDVVSHPSFDDETAKVAITGVVFEWGGFELFPCVDDKGESDNSKMTVVGNIYENPELLGGAGE